MKLRDFTALGRPIDPGYPTNRAIAVLSAIVMVAATIGQMLLGTAWLESAVWGAGVGVTIVLAWAVGRELDPDHDLSAFVGAVLVLPGLLLFDLPSFLLVLWLLLALRIVNRTAGQPAKPLDTVAVFGLGGWLTWQGNWVVGLITAAAFLFDGLLSPPLKYHLLISGSALLATGALFVASGDTVMASGATLLVLVFSIAVAFLFLMVIASSRKVRTVGDATGEPLNPRRVQAAQTLALLTALILAWWEGIPGVAALLPMWAAMVGVAAYRLAMVVRSRAGWVSRTKAGMQKTR